MQNPLFSRLPALYVRTLFSVYPFHLCVQHIKKKTAAYIGSLYVNFLLSEPEHFVNQYHVDTVVY